MISRPSSSQLLAAVRRELSDNVAPAVFGETAEASLEMVDSLLRSIAIRCDHEIAWMLEETAAAEATARAILDGDADSEGRVAAALAQLDSERPTAAAHTAEIQAKYDLGGELLSCCLDAAVPAGGKLREQAEAALESRLAHELEVRGEFSLAGRT